jgi:hypothetical protein
MGAGVLPYLIYRPSSMPSFGLGRCDRRHKLLFQYPIIFWTPRGSLTAMAAAHPDRGGIPHNKGAGMVRSWLPLFQMVTEQLLASGRVDKLGADACLSKKEGVARDAHPPSGGLPPLPAPADAD